jgi:hypothetical protein
MTRGRGYALLALVVAAIVGLSTAIYVGVASDDGLRIRNALGDWP